MATPNHGANNKWSKLYKLTGLPGKTLWDCLSLSAALAIPLVVLIATIGFGLWQTQLADKQHTNDTQLATDQQQEATLKTYLDDMTTILLDKKLGSQNPADKDASAEAAVVARAKTLTVLRHLNGQRKASIVQFLYEAHLIGSVHCNASYCSEVMGVISLIGADLSGTFLDKTILRGVDLSYADLSGANLSNDNLSYANLYYTNLRGADLSGTFLDNAMLSGADLRGADLSFTNLRGADLSFTNLRGAVVTQEELGGAYSLQGATMPDGTKHP